ncbi:MAG: phosphopantetheine-binding protein, partial [Pseudomonadota bacterium]|nr:phosphopantetheine-binding protein [Pseudomonadota bacterium]
DNQIKIRGYRIELGEIETILASHPAVKQSIVAAHKNQDGDKRLVGYLIANEKAFGQKEFEKWKQDQIQQWQNLWQNAYQASNTEDPAFNISGWVSSYNGRPIPAGEMLEWVNSTAERINALDSEKVLEIGSGTGLIAARVAPQVKYYLATDFSSASINSIDNLKKKNKLVSLKTKRSNANNLGLDKKEKFDTIIINSVAQYFPDEKYLVETLINAQNHLSFGGKIFLGDLRNLSLLEVFHTSIEIYKATKDLSLDILNQKIRQRTQQEEELLINPEFFLQLNQILPDLSNIEFQLKRGKFDNEVTCFRYDVILSFDNAQVAKKDLNAIDGLEIKDISEIHNHLNSSDTTSLFIGLKDYRIAREIKAMGILADNTKLRNVEELRQAIKEGNDILFRPEDLYELAKACNKNLQLIYSSVGRFNALFSNKDNPIPTDGRHMLSLKNLDPEKNFNNPLKGKLHRNLVPNIKTYLGKKLPSYMVPSFFSVIDKFPLTPNGKINRNALSPPDQDNTKTYIEPRTKSERVIAEIWANLLGINQVGAMDDFFELGGHSILATQLISRIRDELQLNLPLNTLFDNPTVAALADATDTLIWTMNEAGQNDELSSDIIEEINI